MFCTKFREIAEAELTQQNNNRNSQYKTISYLLDRGWGDIRTSTFGLSIPTPDHMGWDQSSYKYNEVIH